jgi:acyl dehydratase
VAVNREYVGLGSVSREFYVVSREKVREFATAIGDTHPYFHSPQAARDAGFPDVVAPPTFAILVTAGSAAPLLLDPDFKLDYSMVVHGEQRFRHVRPIVAGDELSTRSKILSVRDVGRNEVIETETEVIDNSGEVVCVSTNVLVSRGTAAEASA